MAVLSGVTPGTKTGIIFGPGIVYKDYDVTTGEGTPLGATRGGAEFTTGIVTRQIEVDGLPDPIQCFNVRAPGTGPQLTVNLLEINTNTLRAALPGAAVDPATGGITAGEITDGAYLDNITLVCATSDAAGKRFIVQLFNALATAVNPISFPNDGEAVLQVTFTGHRLVTDIEKEAFLIIPADASPAGGAP